MCSRDMDLAEPVGLQTSGGCGGRCPLFGGVQLAIDTTMVSSRRGTAQQNGKALEEARRRKERTYPELAGEGGRARLIVLGVEAGGGCRSEETAEFLSSLVWAKVREVPEELQAEARTAWLRRWQRLLVCAAAKAFSMSLLGLVPGGSNGATRLCMRCGMRDGFTFVCCWTPLSFREKKSPSTIARTGAFCFFVCVETFHSDWNTKFIELHTAVNMKKPCNNLKANALWLMSDRRSQRHIESRTSVRRT